MARVRFNVNLHILYTYNFLQINEKIKGDTLGVGPRGRLYGIGPMDFCPGSVLAGTSLSPLMQVMKFNY